KLFTLKPPHPPIGLPFFKSAQRREQVFAISRAERGRQPAREDCPVRESWWHRSLLFESLEFLDKRGPLDVQKFRSPVAIPAGSIQTTLNQIALDSCEIGRKVEAFFWKFDERCLSRRRGGMDLGGQIRE